MLTIYYDDGIYIIYYIRGTYTIYYSICYIDTIVYILWWWPIYHIQYEGPARRKFETLRALRQLRTQLLPGPSLPASRKKDRSIVTDFKMVARK